LCEEEDFERYGDDLTNLNDEIAESIFLNQDRLLDYFKTAYDKKYLNIIVKLEFFADYLAYLTTLINDFDTFTKIKELYLNIYDEDQCTLFKKHEKLFKKYIAINCRKKVNARKCIEKVNSSKNNTSNSSKKNNTSKNNNSKNNNNIVKNNNYNSNPSYK
jgi:hypothetical protein